MFVPDRGDVVWLDFDPQRGREIQKMRPALTISPLIYNEKTGLGLFMPITSKEKNYPFVVPIDHDTVTGSILCDQIKSLDWRSRDMSYVLTIPADKMAEVLQKLQVLIAE